MTAKDVTDVLALSDSVHARLEALAAPRPKPMKTSKYLPHDGAKARLRRLRKLPRAALTTEGIAILLEAARREGPRV